jgi:hypothetical protein
MMTSPETPGEVGVLTETGLTRLRVPEGATAMAAVGGHVVASDGRPILHRTPITGEETERVQLAGPAGMAPRRWAGMAGDTVTVVWDERGPPDPERHVVVVVHDATNGLQLVSARTRWSEIESADLSAAQGPAPATIGVGPVLLSVDATYDPIVDVDTTWVRHVDDRAWGNRSNGGVVAVEPDGTVRDFPPGTAIPVGVSAGGALIVVVDGWVHAVNPGDLYASHDSDPNTHPRDREG